MSVTSVLLVFFLCEIISSYSLSEIDREWANYKTQYKVLIPEEEEDFRKKVFKQNMDMINNHNMKNSEFQLGMNKFGHLTHDEYLHYLHKGYKGNFDISPDYEYVPSKTDKKEVDWRKKGIVTRVKDQGACGSCWAFSATGALESQLAMMKNKTLIELSEQDLVDCSNKYGNDGCNGGLMDHAFTYVHDHGINSEKDYPYTAEDGKCKHNDERNVIKVTSYTDVKSGNEHELVKAIKTAGPVSVAIDASGDKFRFYKRGIYSSKHCSSKNLDHGVLAVGYGSRKGDYYIVKNSWGTDWGDHGYILMARNKKNMCGIATAASYPKITPA